MRVLIVGGGRSVFFLCRTFISKGYSVTLINRNEEDCRKTAERLKVTAVHGDGTDPYLLEEIDLHGYEAVLAVTPNDEDNLAVCQQAQRIYGVQKTVALVSDPDNVKVFRKLGITAFSTIRTITSMIEQQTALDEVINLIPAGAGQVNITELQLSSSSPVVGIRLMDLHLSPDSLVAVVLRNGEAIVPSGETTLRKDDKIVLITLPRSHGRIIKTITGEKV
ncbi:MAG: NAD-binding protein [Candidatus Fermentibacteraceae bacterium]